MTFLDFTDLLQAGPVDLALLSTYQFDPAFFEKRLLRCPALADARRIVIFMDAGEWQKLLNTDTPARFVNRRYLVVPVYRSQGVFHPKLTLFLSEEESQLICGSNNLTRSGCSNNLELLNGVTFGGDGGSQEVIYLAQEAFAFFNRACDHAQKEPAFIGQKWLDEAAACYPWLIQSVPASGQGRCRLIHTYEGSLWERLGVMLDTVSPRRLLVISPFHDQDAEMLKRVHRRWPKCRVEVLVQQHITNLPVKVLGRFRNVFALSELRNLKRRLHAKLVAWEGEAGTGCLVGSANFTSAAFDARNVEACLVISDAADLVRLLFDKELAKRPIAFEDFDPGSETEPQSQEGQPVPLRLDSALLLDEGQIRVNYMSRLSGTPSRLCIGIRFAGEPEPHAFASVSKSSGAEVVSFRPAALENAHGPILASLVAEYPGHREESASIWVIQEHSLTHQPGTGSSHSAKDKVKETGDGLIELVEEIRKRDGLADASDYLRNLLMAFHGGGNIGFGRRFRVRRHDPFHPDVAPEWLTTFTTEIEEFAEAIKDFVERHEKRRLRKHARLGNIHGMENFLDVFTTMTRLLYVYYVQSLGMKDSTSESPKTGYYQDTPVRKKKLVTKDQLIAYVCRFIECAAGGIEKEDLEGYLRATANTLNDPNRLRQVCVKNNFAGEIRAALLIVQVVRYVPNDHSIEPSPKRPSEGLWYVAENVRDTFAEVGIAEPSNDDVMKALEQYRMFSDKQLTEFRLELERK